jgi:hypothetical protein
MTQPGLDVLSELPDAPDPSSEELSSYQRPSDWTELFFEWHKTVGILAISFSFLDRQSSALKRMKERNFIVLTSLINRSGRLMMANLRLASENRHAEAMSVVDRALHETAIKAIWLCKSKIRDKFDRYLADGLRHDLEFERYIQRQIAERKYKMEIKRRMLGSIRRSLSTSGISRARISRTKRMPDLYSILQDCGFPNLTYIVIQRMGSHSVHGSWTSLLAHNLAVEGKRLTLKGEFNPPHPNQLMMGSLIVLEAIHAFVESVVKRAERRKILAVIDRYRSMLSKHNALMAAADIARASS